VQSGKEHWKNLMKFIRTGDVKTKLQIKQEQGEEELLDHEANDEHHKNFRKQGDITLYGVVEAARRQAIKENPRMRAAIGMFWHTYASVQNQPGSDDDVGGGGGGGDGSGGGLRITRDEQLAVTVKLTKALFHASEFSLASAKRTALQDWQREASGNKTMDVVQFYDSMFELVGGWVVG
jgi:hypothetical protein